jgi:hypothetical protein
MKFGCMANHSFLIDRGRLAIRDHQNSECVRLTGPDPGVSGARPGHYQAT